MNGQGFALMFLLSGGLTPRAHPASVDLVQMESLLGMRGTIQEGEFKISIPQRELKVAVDGFAIVPPMGLTSWVAFTPHGRGVMAMGDLVLLEDEVGPIQGVAIRSGLSITAIHNHFLRDTPKVMFMHLAGMGSAEEIARAVRRVLDKIPELRSAKNLSPEPAAVESKLDPKEIEPIIGHTGQMTNGVLRIVIGRPDVPLKDMGAPVSAFMGFNTWMAFQGTAARAAVSGDFTMLEAEVDGVIRELVSHGIEVTAVHNHMVTERPRIFFLHFWGVDRPANLARGLRAALDRTGKREKP